MARVYTYCIARGANYFERGFWYAALQEHTASFSANRATHVTSLVILFNACSFLLFFWARLPHTHNTHSHTHTLNMDKQHFAIGSTLLKAGIFSVVLTEGLNCREVCNGNLCCVIAREEETVKQRLVFSLSLYFSVSFFFVLFFMQEKEYLYYSFWCLYSLDSLSLFRLRLPSPLPPRLTFICVQFVVKSSIVGGPFFTFLRLSWNWAWTCMCGEVSWSPNIIYIYIYIHATVSCVGVPLRSPVNIQGFLHMRMHTIQL